MARKQRVGAMEGEGRDEALGALLRGAAAELSHRGPADFATLYRGLEEPAAKPFAARARLPLHAAAAALLLVGLLLPRSSAGGYPGAGGLFPNEVAFLSASLVGYRAQPVFAGIGGQDYPGAAAAPVPSSEELTNFVADLWNRDNG